VRKGFFQSALLLFVLVLALLSPTVGVFGAAPPAATSYEREYTFEVQYGFSWFSHKLYVSMPSSLYEHYSSKSHIVYGDSDYSKFVTPSVFKSVAVNIQNVTGDLPYSEEQFANAVLMLVRQITYVKSDVQYPVETLIGNSGDCDVLSLLAASILKAGGLDVVLLYYKGLSPSHMNIGVCLPHTPVYRTWWLAPASFEYNNKTYWMAECTSMGAWKVGDRPELMAGAKPQIIPVENCEQTSPAQVGSSLDVNSFESSAVSLTVSSENASTAENGCTLTFSGLISPAYSGRNVTLYVNQNGYSRNAFRTVSTDEFGNYSFTWDFTSIGIYSVRASLSGFANHSGSDSEELIVFTGFYKPPVPAETDYWNVLSTGSFARASAASLYALSAGQRSKEILQRDFTGSGVLLSSEFIVLRNVEEATTVENETNTARGNTRYAAVRVSEQDVLLLDEPPPRDWFGFVLQSNGENNCTARVSALNGSDATKLTQRLTEDNTAFMNASISVKENMWYTVKAKIICDAKFSELYDADGTLLQNVTGASSVLNVSASGVLVGYDPDAVVVFRNLNAESLEQSAPTVDNNQAPAENEYEKLTPCIWLTVLIVVTVAAATCIKERKRVRVTQASGS
jgi:hypothetical protein